MRTNIEHAIHELILSNKDITLANALPAYLRVAGFKKISPDALIAFEHALDKYPTRTEASRADFVKGIYGISTEYWTSKYNTLAIIPCTYCDTHACQVFNLKAEAKAHVCGSPEDEGKKGKASKRRLTSKKKGVRAKRDVTTARFDPFAPSTSAVML
ncbi:hypothetical protein OG21DRAFT_1517776 [Imleria badia]|nr:hypothetical protein OG21DRAFT_1517776 [Imleria badia]